MTRISDRVTSVIVMSGKSSEFIIMRRMTRIGDRVNSVIVMSDKSSDLIIGEEDDQDL